MMRQVQGLFTENASKLFQEKGKKLGFMNGIKVSFFLLFASPFVCFISHFVFISMHLCVTNSSGFYLRLRLKNRFRFAF